MPDKKIVSTANAGPRKLKSLLEFIGEVVSDYTDPVDRVGKSMDRVKY